MNPSSTDDSRQASAHDGVSQVPTLPTRVATLANGNYHVRLSGVGSGCSDCGGVAISRSMPGSALDSDGFHIYLRDLDSGLLWSAGYQPTQVNPSLYRFRHNDKYAEISRTDDRVECLLSVCVAAHDDFEMRCCRLANHDDHERRIELTSYVEWVLGDREADASHPAFSKLFVETQFDRVHNAILARRRPRHSDDEEFWGFHTVVLDAANGDSVALEFETNRANFIGRGRTCRRPYAFDPECGPLRGEIGSVLDPIASLRTAVLLEPGQSRQIVFVLGGASTRDRLENLMNAVSDQLMRQEVEMARSSFQLEAEASAGPAPTPPSDRRRSFIHPPHRIKGNVRACELSPPRHSVATAANNGSDAAKIRLETPISLRFENNYGGFSADGREYIIRLRPNGKGGLKLPPAPWVNVIANARAGFIITESGAGYTWSGNSRTNRLTAWHNDPISDPHSEALWIRDDDANVFWSPMPGPTPAATEYRVRHGFGYTTFENDSFDVAQEVAVFMARSEPVKMTRLKLVNHSDRSRRLSIFSHTCWSLGPEHSSAVSTSKDEDQRVIWAANATREHYGGCIAFSALNVTDESSLRDISNSCGQATFVGRCGDLCAPQSLLSGGPLNGRVTSEGDSCAAWRLTIDLAPGQSFDCTYLLGEVTQKDEAISLIRKYRAVERIERELADVRSFWIDTVSAITIETPDPEIDLMVNGWLVYQNMSCRLWGRSAYYQPGGAFGFRDQLQDAASLIYHRPDLTRAQILCHAAQQFVEGDVLHWWHPDTGCGLRTRFSDDLLWLPFVVAEYVQTTGDAAILDEEIPFITATRLADGQDEAYLRPLDSGIRATLYEHCCRAIDRSLTKGRHGLPLIGTGDWNDGFSRIGHRGDGESVWLGFFLVTILGRMLPLCRERNDHQRMSCYEEYCTQLRAALNSAGWDGAWYRRAFYDDGSPIGSKMSDECQIDALAQAWAVLSKVAPPDRARMAMDAVESRLIDNAAGIIRLLAPAFNRTPHDPGYIKGYLPGIRENGGQYTHGVLWAVRAIAELGRGSRAVELLRCMTPVWHTATPERVEIYKTEPYVVAADIYGEPPHVGRGGWTWYTGSAGWMLRVAVESILGLGIENGQTLIINPCISAEWQQCRLTYRLPGDRTTYTITIENPNGKETGVIAATCDDTAAVVTAGRARVPLVRDGLLHRVLVQL